MHAVPKSCSWNDAQRCGFIGGMDEEKRERIIVACTKAAMMMEELSVKALGSATMDSDELGELVRELRSDLAAILDILKRN